MRDGDYLNREISPHSNWFRSQIDGVTYATIGPMPEDRPDAPELVEWRGYVLRRQPAVYYGDFLGWWNRAEVNNYTIDVDGGTARISRENVHGSFEVFEGSGKDPGEALEAAREAPLASLRSWAEIFGGTL